MNDNIPKHKNSYHAGANSDIHPEKAFVEDNGEYIDSVNAQPTSQTGYTGAIEKIKGEVIRYSNNQTGYKCIGSEQVNSYLVEFWAPVSNAFPTIVRINGVIVLSSVLLDFRQNYPLQIDKNRSASFSEVVVNDRKQVPFLFNLKDMVDSVSTNKYTTAFDPLLYQLNEQSPLDIMVFRDLVDVGGGGGLPVGGYQYQLQYASKDGDVTRWSHPTPIIPIMQGLSSASSIFPGSKTFGGDSNPAKVTSLAPRLKFRVTNVYNYDYIQIKRIDYNTGSGIEYTPNGKIVARINISAGEISVREYIDPQNSNENIDLGADDESRQVAYIEKCESVRYFDRRIVIGGPTFPTRITSVTFKTTSGSKSWPIVSNIGKLGYKDPFNFVYRKSEMRGDIVGYGINFYDGVGNKGYTQKAESLEAFQFPNRRDTMSAITSDHSFGEGVKAANSTAGAVAITHEVFDHYDSVAKSDKCSFKNITESGRVAGLTGTKTTSTVTKDCGETNDQIEQHGADVSALNLVSSSYQPFTPIRENDQDTTGHNYIVNTKVSKGNVNVGPVVVETADVFSYNPNAFANRYYAMGIAISGIDNIPSWVKSFSVVRTDSAKRVLAQGIGFYAMQPGAFKLVGNASLATKEKNKLWFYSPDIENGYLSSETLNDLIQNPQNYKAQFVSPLGFFSEYYSAESNLIAGQRDRCTDMISYARILRDQTGGSINPGENTSMGIPSSDADGFRYITHDKWRNQNGSSVFSGSADQGNTLVNISVVRRKVEGRGNYLELEFDKDIYSTGSVGGNADSNFEDTGLQNFHEPLHIVNIVRVGATIRDADIQKYRQTTHYQKLESIIGKSTGAAGQSFQLIDERWEDCIPSPLAGQFGNSTARFIYIKLSNGTLQKWQNSTYLTAGQITLLEADILNNATDVKGLYRHENVNSLSREFNIIFDVKSFIPEDESLIIVKYDNTAPIRVFGGDAFIGEAIFAPIDRESSARDKAAETQFAMGIGMPYKDFKINPRYYTVRKAGASLNVIQDREWFTLGFVRQLCVMASVESRACTPLAHGDNFFPNTNYVIRPNRWDADKDQSTFYKDNGIFQDYQDDYGDEYTKWKWGGFRFTQKINPDYSVQPPKAFFSKPEFGFTEILYNPTMVINSLPRSISSQNSPGLKTFPANNFYIVEDDQGGIKYLWDSTSETGGESLFAFTNTGIVKLMTRKAILSNVDGSSLAIMNADSFINQHLWIEKEIGMYDEMWRGAAESIVPITMEGGKEVMTEAIFFPSRQSVYMFMQNQLIDIGAGKYHSRIYRDGIMQIGTGLSTHITGVFDRYKKQYYLHIGLETPVTFVYSQKNGYWIGTNEFYFDRFTANANETYGHRDMKTYTLNQGYIINGSPVKMTLKGAACPESTVDKEYVRFRINSNKKPDLINFKKEKGGLVQCEINGSALKDYRGYEQLISRINSSVNSSRPRLQGRIVFFDITETSEQEFMIIDTSVSYIKLKM